MKIGTTPLEARSIASAISGRLKVTISEGVSWAYNFEKNLITYRKEDLRALTRHEVVANLLHESGHAKYSTDPREMKYPDSFSKNHKDKIHFLVNAIEDFRIEDLVRAYYPYAIDYLPEYSFKTYYILKTYEDRSLKSGKKVPKYTQYCFGIYSYIANVEINSLDEDVQKVVDKTKKYALSGRFVSDNQKITDIVVKKIYPLVKKWFDDWEEDDYIGIVMTEEVSKMYPDYNELYAKVRPLIKPVTEKFKRILTDNLFDKYTGKYRSGGRIIQDKLYRHRTGDFNLFRRKYDAKSKGYVFALLVDESGSMRFDKAINASSGAIIFSHVLNDLNIKFGLYGFNAKFKKYKSPLDPFKTKHQSVFESMMANTQDDEEETHKYNNDAEAVFLTSKDLSAFPEERKVIIVLSDGQPAPSNESMGKGFTDLRTQIKLAEKKDIQFVGIGIQTPAVANFYTNHIIIDDLKDLPQVLISTLKRKLA